MKPFSLWTIITLIIFGIISGAYHLYLTTHPRKILIAIDSSFPMQSVWHRVPYMLETFADQRYTSFSLVTEKNKVHSWSSTLNLGTVMPYAPRDFSKLTNSTVYQEIDEATQKYLITNMETSENKNFTGWTILQLTP